MIEEIEKIKALSQEILDLDKDQWNVWLIIENGPEPSKRLETVVAKTMDDAYEKARKQHLFFFPSNKVTGLLKAELKGIHDEP